MTDDWSDVGTSQASRFTAPCTLGQAARFSRTSASSTTRRTAPRGAAPSSSTASRPGAAARGGAHGRRTAYGCVDRAFQKRVSTCRDCIGRRTACGQAAPSILRRSSRFLRIYINDNFASLFASDAVGAPFILILFQL